MKIVLAAVIMTIMSVVFVYFAFAQTTGIAPVDDEAEIAGITFPIPELGNCTDKAACKAYCDNPTNIDACTAFAQTHGLMSKEEAEHAKKFKRSLEEGTTPGGCKTPDECKSYCSDIRNIESCLAFAKAQGIKDEHSEEGEKVFRYIKAGGAMPGGCTSRDTCDAYCSDFDHAEECLAFAEKAGLTVTRGGEGDIPPGQFRKFIELAKRGETPGGCTSKDACETYCRDSSHFEECVSFGEKIGFIPPAEAEKIRKTGGKGPGGCTSAEACRSFCDDPAHRDECFRFAEEHGLMPKEELERAKEGLVRLKQGLDQAPPEVVECLKSTLGQNIIEDIQSSKLVPGPQIGERMRACFERFGESHRPEDALRNAPPQIISCLREKGGERFEHMSRGELAPTPDMADLFRECAQAFRPDIDRFPATDRVNEGRGEGADMPVRPMNDASSGVHLLRPQSPFGSRPPTFGPGAAPAVNQCLKERLSPDQLLQLQRGVRPTAEMENVITQCFSQGGPQPSGMMPLRFGMPSGTPQGDGVHLAPGGFAPGDFNTQYQEQFQQQFNEQYKAEYQQQYQQYREQYQYQPPPTGSYPPPEGTYTVPPPPPASLRGVPPTASVFDILISPLADIIGR